MKTTKRTLTAAAACLALSIGIPTAGAETLDEIRAKHLEARGGLDKILSVESVKVTGTMTMGGQMEAPFRWEWKRPNRFRIEFEVQGMTGIQAYDGENAWMLMPFMGTTEPEPVPEDQVKLMEQQADFDGPFVNTEEKGYGIEYIGEEEVEGTDAHKLKVTTPHGDVSYVYLDAEYFLEIKSEGKREIQGQEMEFEATQGDYKEVDGLMFAHSIESRPLGAPAGQVLTFEKIELNVEIDESRFAMPEVEKEAEADDDAGGE